MSRLDGRRVLVVGASRGIGRAIGLMADREGAAVAFAARTVAALDDAVASCRGRAVAVPCDVRDPASCADLVAATIEGVGGLDALVYATGMTRFTELADATANDWREVFETNLFGAGLITAAAAGHLRAARGQAIYLTSESAQFRPMAWRGIGLYVASKTALESMVRSWNAELPEVRCTTYVVGATLTGFADADAANLTPFLTDWFDRGYVGHRMLDPDHHARAVIDVLASDAWVETVAVRAK